MTQSTLEKNLEKPLRMKKSLEEEIARQREKLKRLEDRHREQQSKWRDKNQKAVFELIRSEKLDMVDIEKWQSAIQQIKSILR